MAWFVLHVSWIEKQEHAWEVMGHARAHREVDGTCAQAANEQDSEKLMALIKQIAALLDTKPEQLIEKDSQRLKSERIN
jgi:hypothetical protein